MSHYQVVVTSESSVSERWTRTPLFCPSCGASGLASQIGSKMISADDDAGTQLTKSLCTKCRTVILHAALDTSPGDRERISTLQDFDTITKSGGTGALVLDIPSS